MNIKDKSYDYLILIAMIYMAIDLSSMVFTYKIIEFGPFVGAASSLIFPLTYSIMDITAEVYGYQTAKKIILYSFVCDLIFALLVLLISKVPSTNLIENAAYIHVLGSLLRAVIAQTIGVLSGAVLNIYLISKWKIMTNGRYFWLRSIGSSTIGEGIMLIISVFIALTGILSLSKIFLLIFYTYIYKIIFAIVAAPLVSLSATILKNKSPHHVNLNSWNILNNQDFSANFQKL